MNYGRSLELAKRSLYDLYGLRVEHFKLGNESAEYEACTYEINGQRVVSRTAKITPKKIGQFVAIWRRDIDGVTTPHTISDPVDILVINVHDQKHSGQFVFPKSVLIEKGIFSSSSKQGKRGMRVYPPWDELASEQAHKTQKWQTEYFLPIENQKVIDVRLGKKLYSV